MVENIVMIGEIVVMIVCVDLFGFFVYVDFIVVIFEVYSLVVLGLGDLFVFELIFVYVGFVYGVIVCVVFVFYEQCLVVGCMEVGVGLGVWLIVFI